MLSHVLVQALLEQRHWLQQMEAFGAGVVSPLWTAPSLVLTGGSVVLGSPVTTLNPSFPSTTFPP